MTINASDLFKDKKILWSDYKDEIESSNQETVYECGSDCKEDLELEIIVKKVRGKVF